MIRHIVTWNFKEGFSEAEKIENARQVKARLEGLKERISGLITLEVHIEALPTSNRDVVLNSLFESEEALAAYQIQPRASNGKRFRGRGPDEPGLHRLPGMTGSRPTRIINARQGQWSVGAVMVLKLSGRVQAYLLPHLKLSRR